MKIAIVLVISVIFASGIYTANAEEPIPTLIFEGGDYTIHSGNPIHVPVIIQVENHDHKVFPKIYTIFENQIIDEIALKQSSSGYFQIFLNINENYATGSHHLQLEYDGKKLPPIPFNIIRDHEQQKERTLGFGDYTIKSFEPKESVIEILEKHIDVEFSTSINQEIEGVYDYRGKSGKIQLEIKGPKSMTNHVRMSDTGSFETSFIIDREWPTGTYQVTGYFFGKSFVSDEFTIKNFNKDSLIKDEPITGELNLEAIKSNQFNVILIEGKVVGDTHPEQVAVRIYESEEIIETLYINVDNTGNFETNLVLYDYKKKSPWNKGKYFVDVLNAATLESYDINSKFEITKSGNTLTKFEHGMLLKDGENVEEALKFVKKLEVKKYHPKEIKVFGIIESYISGTPIIISVVNEKGNVDEFSIFAKKEGHYDVPVVINEQWEDGNYDVYVNYGDEIQNSVSFNIDKEPDIILAVDKEEEVTIDRDSEIKEFTIVQKDSNTSQFIKLQFSTTKNNPGLNHIHAILQKPDESESIYKVRILQDGVFEVPLIIENSWNHGNYELYIMEDDKKVVFGKFSIIKEQKETQNVILSDVLETANPESIYKIKDEVTILTDVVTQSHDGIYLDVKGAIQDYSSGDTILSIFEKDVLFSEHKISPKSDGMFFSPTLIKGELSKGFHEINVTHDKRVVGVSEFLIISPMNLYVELGSKPIKISHDMFEETGNRVGVNVIGFIEDFDNTNYNSVEFTISKPNGKIERYSEVAAKWGYYSHELVLTDKWEKGTYVISAVFDGKKLGHVYLQILDFDIEWLKTHTQKWIDKEISSYQYENRLNTAISKGIIEMEPIEQNAIPDWVRMNAEGWIEGKLTQKEFLDVIKFVGIT